MIMKNSNGNDATTAGYLTDDTTFIQALVQTTVQAVLEAEMTDHLGAAKSERTDARKGYRSGSYPRQLHMKVGTLELRVLQSRDGHVQHEGVRAVSPLGKGARDDVDRAVRERHVHAEGWETGRTPVWAAVLGGDHLEPGGDAGYGAAGVRIAAVG